MEFFFFLLLTITSLDRLFIYLKLDVCVSAKMCLFIQVLGASLSKPEEHLFVTLILVLLSPIVCSDFEPNHLPPNQ